MEQENREEWKPWFGPDGSYRHAWIDLGDGTTMALSTGVSRERSLAIRDRILADHRLAAVAREALEKIVAHSEMYPPCEGELDDNGYDPPPPTGFCSCKYSDRDDVAWHAKRKAWAEVAIMARAALRSLTEGDQAAGEEKKGSGE